MIDDTEFRQVSQDRIGALCTDAAEAAYDPALVSQVRFVIDKLVDCRFHRVDLTIEMCNQIENGSADQIIATLMTTRFLFRTSINKLLASRNQLFETAMLSVCERCRPGPHALAIKGKQPGVDPIRFGEPSKALGELAYEL